MLGINGQSQIGKYGLRFSISSKFTDVVQSQNTDASMLSRYNISKNVKNSTTVVNFVHIQLSRPGKDHPRKVQWPTQEHIIIP